MHAGVLHAELQQWDAAEEALRKGIELAPQRTPGYRALVQVLMSANRKLSEAKALARKLAELKPDAGNYFLLSEVCEREGDLAGALAARRRAAELDPGSEKIRKAYKRLQQKE